jgi:hypothetical protein
MNPEFRTYLSELNKHATSAETETSLAEERRKHLTADGIDIETMKELYGLRLQDQRDLYAKQLDKQLVMERLHRQLQEIDGKEPTADEDEWDEALPNPEHQIPVRQERGAYITSQGDMLTLGDLYTAGEWNIHYALDSSVDRSIRKRYAVEEARRELQDLTDWQIYFDHLHGDESTLGATKAMYEVVNNSPERQEQPGIVAEKIVLTFLQKVCIDFNLDVETLKADVQQDVLDKIDFILHRKEHGRAFAHPEQSDKLDAKDIGIQFTIISNPQAWAKNTSKINDVVLTSISPEGTRAIMHAYHEWTSGNRAITPENLLPLPIQKRIFIDVLKNMPDLSEADLTVIWENSIQPALEKQQSDRIYYKQR